MSKIFVVCVGNEDEGGPEIATHDFETAVSYLSSVFGLSPEDRVEVTPGGEYHQGQWGLERSEYDRREGGPKMVDYNLMFWEDRNRNLKFPFQWEYQYAYVSVLEVIP
jgi:hypothetical protein